MVTTENLYTTAAAAAATAAAATSSAFISVMIYEARPLFDFNLNDNFVVPIVTN